MKEVSVVVSRVMPEGLAAPEVRSRPTEQMRLPAR